MAAPARVVLGESTLNRKWWLDINTGTYSAPIWTPVGGVSDFKWSETKIKQDDSDRDSGGAKSQTTTAYSHQIALKLQRKVSPTDDTAYDTGQEVIRAACKRTTGLSNVVDMRWYEMTINDAGSVVGPTSEAYRGQFIAEWAEDGGAMDALDTVTVTLDGRGAYSDITHPEASSPVPTVASATPSTGILAAGGELVYLKGQYFTGAVSVTIGGTDADDFAVIDDYTIAIITPAKTAGTYTIVVTNDTGPDTDAKALTYTDV